MLQTPSLTLWLSSSVLSNNQRNCSVLPAFCSCPFFPMPTVYKDQIGVSSRPCTLTLPLCFSFFFFPPYAPHTTSAPRGSEVHFWGGHRWPPQSGSLKSCWVLALPICSTKRSRAVGLFLLAGTLQPFVLLHTPVLEGHQKKSPDPIWGCPSWAASVFPRWDQCSVQISAVCNAAVTHIFSKMYCSVDFIPSWSLWCIVHVLSPANRIPQASDPSGGPRRPSPACFDIPCLSDGNEPFWNGPPHSLAMFPSCLSGQLLYPIAPGAVQRLL